MWCQPSPSSLCWAGWRRPGRDPGQTPRTRVCPAEEHLHRQSSIKISTCKSCFVIIVTTVDLPAACLHPALYLRTWTRWLFSNIIRNCFPFLLISSVLLPSASLCWPAWDQTPPPSWSLVWRVVQTCRAGTTGPTVTPGSASPSTGTGDRWGDGRPRPSHSSGPRLSVTPTTPSTVRPSSRTYRRWRWRTSRWCSPWWTRTGTAGLWRLAELG